MSLVELGIGVTTLLAASVAFTLIIPLPGLWAARRSLGDVDIQTLAIGASVLSVISLSAVAGTLVAIGCFSGLAVAVAAVSLSVVGIGSLLRRRPRVRRSHVVAVLALGVAAAPWAIAALRPGFPPAETLQWYYWDIGRDLAGASGVPQSVREYGWDVRWLPDYLFFNALSEVFHALLPVPAAGAAQVWRLPVTFMGIWALYVTARLWLQRTPAILAVAATVSTLFFLNKFNAYKPESLAIVIGLLSAWLVIRGLRSRRIPMMLIGGLGIGIVMAIHAIAAVVIGLLLASACIVEVAAAPKAPIATLRLMALGAAFAVALAVTIGTGASLQGRALVAGDALRPEISESQDPTWTYLRYSYGNFDGAGPPPVSERLASGVTRPWPGVPLLGLTGMWAMWLGGFGWVLAAAYGKGKVRRGLATGLLAGIVLAAGMAYFAIAFDTYVPQHTGLVRIGQYVPLLFGLSVGFAFEGYLYLWRSLAGSTPSKWLLPVVMVAATVWLVASVNTDYTRDARIPPEGLEALRILDTASQEGDVVLTNATTTGTIEFFTGAENPLEGRQPLIEEPAFLDQANRLLLSAHRLFAEQDPAILHELGVRWLLVVDSPSILGAPGSFGGTVASVGAQDWAELEWSGDGVSLFRTVGVAVATTPEIAPGPTRLLPWASAVASVAALLLAAVVGLRKLAGRVASAEALTHRVGAGPVDVGFDGGAKPTGSGSPPRLPGPTTGPGSS